jgi:hypothetical protein
MIWRKNKSGMDDAVSTVHTLARELGVERRVNVRVRYPLVTTGPLPAIFVADAPIRVHDISIGGCCLLDVHERLGITAGETIPLELVWSDSDRLLVNSRLVGSVDLRRHMQFLDLPPSRLEALKKAMQAGVEGLGLRIMVNTENSAIPIEALEIYSSLSGDSLVLESDIYRVGSVVRNGQTIVLYRNGRPHYENKKPLTHTDFLELILFIANLPSRSRALDELLLNLENQILKGEQP